MKNPRPLTLWHTALLLAMAAAIASWHLRDRDRLRTEPTKNELADALGGAAGPSVTSGPLKYWRRADGGDVAATVTTLAPPAIKGYVDQISALIAVNRAGKITSVVILDQRETPAYFDRLLSSGLPDRFASRDPAEAAKIDTITSATVSSRALISDVSTTADALAASAFGLPRRLPSPPCLTAALSDWRLWCLWAGLGVALVSRLSRLGRRPRPAARVLVVALIGFLALAPYTLAHTFQLFRFDFPSTHNLIFLSLLFFVLGSTLVSGPVWCAHACPFGALQELTALAPVKKWRVSPGLMNWARELRWLTLAVTTVTAFAFGIGAAGDLEPFYYLFGHGAPSAGWALVALALFFSLFVRRFWCRFFCPTGLCLILLSSHRRWWKPAGRGLDDSGIDRPDQELEELKE